MDSYFNGAQPIFPFAMYFANSKKNDVPMQTLPYPVHLSNSIHEAYIQVARPLHLPVTHRFSSVFQTTLRIYTGLASFGRSKLPQQTTWASEYARLHLVNYLSSLSLVLCRLPMQHKFWHMPFSCMILYFPRRRWERNERYLVKVDSIERNKQ